jgi:hypothetical protein
VDICTLKYSLEVLLPILALIAAAFWFASAWAGWFPFVSTPWGTVERYIKWQAILSGTAAAPLASHDFIALLESALSFAIIPRLPLFARGVLIIQLPEFTG